jgi:hypothetical protein
MRRYLPENWSKTPVKIRIDESCARVWPPTRVAHAFDHQRELRTRLTTNETCARVWRPTLMQLLFSFIGARELGKVAYKLWLQLSSSLESFSRK